MRGKDIALTVAGVLATMALAYLFYRQQQHQAAAPAVQDVTSPDYATNQGLYDASMAYQYASQLPSLSVPTVSSTSSTSAVASQVDTSASTAATGHTPDTDALSLISQILANYHTDNPAATSAAVYQGADFSGLVIPTIDTQPLVTISGIPTTAADALTNANNMIANPPGPTAPDPTASPIPYDPGTGATYSVSGGLTDTSTAATAAPSTQAPAVTTVSPPALHNNHIMATVQEAGY